MSIIMAFRVSHQKHIWQLDHIIFTCVCNIDSYIHIYFILFFFALFHGFYEYSHVGCTMHDGEHGMIF